MNFVLGVAVGAASTVALTIAWRSGFLAAQWAKLKTRWPWLPG
jgi:hypothetical protein